MKILVFANDALWNELVTGHDNIEWLRAENIDDFTSKDGVDAYINLSENALTADYTEFKRPVLINSVPGSLQKANTPENVVRINGWTGFIKRDSWEVAGKLNDETAAVIKAMNKKCVHVSDEPGFIAARIIAMIINEAYFAKAEAVSTENEIDIAMKLGTNYPYGPFEWSKMIGIKNIYDLLKTLSETDTRYKPSRLLEEEAIKNK